MEEIYIEYGLAQNTAARFEDIATDIDSMTNQFRSYLEDLNSQWQAKKCTIFTERMEEYFERFNKISNYYKDCAENIRMASSKYNQFDEFFTGQGL